MPEIALVIGAVASVGGTLASMSSQRRAARASARQQAAQARRQRRQAIREAALTRAQAVASASAVGADGSSAAQGGQASVGSQLGSNFGFGSQMSSLSRDIISARRGMANAEALSGLGGALFKYGANTPQGEARLNSIGQGFSSFFSNPFQNQTTGVPRRPRGGR